ncbi:hypothetical protein PR048_008163 [Dryococelus australis]|uniref:Uncharacterized protein n=1 Tax=Dryococelus australis TaxID=614101 RepID=A0ABQ9HWB9_9NEOP|nr:hypothetical protein PR048_008163 [Dryococelus australis]
MVTFATVITVRLQGVMSRGKWGFLRVKREPLELDEKGLSEVWAIVRRQAIGDEPEEQRVAPEVASRRKICDCEHRCSEGCGWQAGLLDWVRDRLLPSLAACSLPVRRPRWYSSQSTSRLLPRLTESDSRRGHPDFSWVSSGYSLSSCRPPVAKSVGAPPIWGAGGSGFESRPSPAKHLSIKPGDVKKPFTIQCNTILSSSPPPTFIPPLLQLHLISSSPALKTSLLKCRPKNPAAPLPFAWIGHTQGERGDYKSGAGREGLATNPFHVDIDLLPETLIEQALEVKNGSTAKYDFEKIDKTLFWVKYFKVYPDIAEQALRLNLKPPKLCNGTRLQVESLDRNVAEANILTGSAQGETVFVPRILLIANDLAFEFKRLQYWHIRGNHGNPRDVCQLAGCWTVCHMAARNTNNPASVTSHTERGRGGLVVRVLASHLGEPGSIPGGTPPDFRMWESCRTGVSTEIYRFPDLAFRRCSILTTLTLISSQNLDPFQNGLQCPGRRFIICLLETVSGSVVCPRVYCCDCNRTRYSPRSKRLQSSSHPHFTFHTVPQAFGLLLFLAYISRTDWKFSFVLSPPYLSSTTCLSFEMGTSRLTNFGGVVTIATPATWCAHEKGEWSEDPNQERGSSWGVSDARQTQDCKAPISSSSGTAVSSGEARSRIVNAVLERELAEGETLRHARPGAGQYYPPPPPVLFYCVCYVLPPRDVVIVVCGSGRAASRPCFLLSHQPRALLIHVWAGDRVEVRGVTLSCVCHVTGSRPRQASARAGRRSPRETRAAAPPHLAARVQHVRLHTSRRRALFDSRRNRPRIFACDNLVTGRRAFSGSSRFPRPCIPALLHTHFDSPQSALKASMIRVAHTYSIRHRTARTEEVRDIPEKTRGPAALSGTMSTLCLITVAQCKHGYGIEESAAPVQISYACCVSHYMQLQSWQPCPLLCPRGSHTQVTSGISIGNNHEDVGRVTSQAMESPPRPIKLPGNQQLQQWCADITRQQWDEHFVYYVVPQKEVARSTSVQSMPRQSPCFRVLQAPSRTISFTRRFHTLLSSPAVVPQSPVVVNNLPRSRTLARWPPSKTAGRWVAAVYISSRSSPIIFPNSRDASRRAEAPASLTRTFLRRRQTRRNLQQGRRAVTQARRRAA